MRVLSIAHWLTMSVAVASVSVLGCGSVGSKMEEDRSEPSGDTTVVAESTFEGREGQSASGAYRILRIGEDDLRLVFEENFSVDDGPDLHVVLSPKSLDEVTGDNVMDGQAKRIDDLKTPSGKQEYDLPDDLEMTTFKTVAVQCIQYAHLFGAAQLE